MSLIRGAGSMSAIEITRQNLSISQLRAAAARTADAKQTRRILAIAMVLDGHSRRLAAQAGGMDRQTLRDWVWQGFAADWSSDQRAFKNVPWGSWLISGRFGLCTWLELLHVR
jgi:hypothetical protein